MSRTAGADESPNPTRPACVDAFDERLLAMPNGSLLQCDPVPGFHFYGADLGLTARERGLATVVLDALRFHNSSSTGLPPSLAEGAKSSPRNDPPA